MIREVLSGKERIRVIQKHIEEYFEEYTDSRGLLQAYSDLEVMFDELNDGIVKFEYTNQDE